MRFPVGLAAALAAVVAVSLALSGPGARAHGVPGRISEPIVLTGADLAPFAGAAPAELWGYAYDHGDWDRFRVQMDERDAGDDIVASEDGLLDANDEVVFMADLVGQRRDPAGWPMGIAREHPAAEVRITDPLIPGYEGYVYLFRSSSGPEMAFAPLVRWDPDRREARSRFYSMGMAEPARDGFVGIKSIGVGAGDDLLDRMKIRVTVRVLGIPQTLTEEDLGGPPYSLPGVNAVTTGPVRVVLDAAGAAAAYERRAKIATGLDDVDTSAVPGLFEIGSVAASLDFLPAAGVGEYLDANLAAPVAIDGTPEAVPAQPVVPWRSVSFLDGRIVILSNGLAADVPAENTYNDGGPVTRDTGDGVAYGEIGVAADDLDSLLAAGYPGDFVFISPGQSVAASDLVAQRESPLVAEVSFAVAPTPTGPTPTSSSTPPASATPSATPPATSPPTVMPPPSPTASESPAPPSPEAPPPSIYLPAAHRP